MEGIKSYFVFEAEYFTQYFAVPFGVQPYIITCSKECLCFNSAITFLTSNFTKYKVGLFSVSCTVCSFVRRWKHY